MYNIQGIHFWSAIFSPTKTKSQKHTEANQGSRSPSMLIMNGCLDDFDSQMLNEHTEIGEQESQSDGIVACTQIHQQKADGA